MTAHILQMLALPDSPEALPRWLEKQLIGPDLVGLVAELEATRSSPAKEILLSEALGDSMPALLQDGLIHLSRIQLQVFLAHPDHLRELQTAILLYGGEYWDDLLAGDAELKQMVSPAKIKKTQPRKWSPANPNFPSCHRYRHRRRRQFPCQL